MQTAIAKGNKHSAKDYAEAIDFKKRSYESYQEVFEDYHGGYLSIESWCCT